MKQTIAVVLIFAQMGQAFAALPQEPSSRTIQRIGILRAGSLSPSQAKAYPLLEKNIQKWMENHDDLRVIGEPISQGISQDEWAEVAVESEVERLLRRVPGIVEEIEKDRVVDGMKGKVSKLPKHTPLYQRVLVADALWDWQHGRKERAARTLRHAIRLHPIGEVNLDWDEENPGFLALLSQLTSQLNRSCVLDLAISPSGARVAINGFLLSEKEYRALLTGKMYRLRVEAPGYEAKDEMVSCLKSQRVKASVRLNRGSEPRLSLFGAKYQTLLFIKPERDRFRLFLYSQERAMDEIPLEKPLRVADVVESGVVEIPVSDAAPAIFEKHRIDLAANIQYSDSTAAALRLDERKEDQWYNDWRVWAIAGGLVAGGVAAYLMTKNGGSVGTQNRIGVKID